MSESGRRYVIVSPVRDEEAYLEHTLESVINQTQRPAQWVVVDDGSTDRTAMILDRYAEQHSWIKPLHRADRGHREAGSGVMEAFHAGLAQLDHDDWDYLVKLDGDLTFEADYFERCLDEFDREPRLGIGGGEIDNLIEGQRVREKHPSFHVRGATKIYRRRCWEQIGGLYRVAGWDTLDEVKANQLGWQTRSFPDLVLVQHRFTGEAAGQWHNWVKNGKASYIVGYHPLYLLAKAAVRARRRPYIVASFGVLRGFFGAYVENVSQIDDPSLIRYLRHHQLRRLFGLSSIWR